MKTKKVAFLGLSIALAMILSFVESQIPALVAIPGIKVGLPNLAIVFLLYRVGAKEAVIVSIIRIILVSMLFGNVQTLTFSIAGAVLSLLSMIILKKTNWF
jgi:heptaprenyl diphosphate synthase